MEKQEKIDEEEKPLHHYPIVQGMHLADSYDIWTGFFEKARELATLARTRREARQADVIETETPKPSGETA